MLQTIRNFLTHRISDQAVEPPKPERFEPVLPVEDDAEQVVQTGVDEVLGMAFAIRYRDAKGQESARRITIRKVSKSDAGKVMVSAYCHERRAPRAFRGDRIIEMVDLATGEVAENILAALHGVAIENGEDTALYRCRHELQVFAYLGRADGHFDTAEQGVVADYVATASPDLIVDKAAVAAHASRMYPDLDSFYRSVDHIVDEMGDRELGQFLDAVKALVMCDGRLDDEEAELIREINDALELR